MEPVGKCFFCGKDISENDIQLGIRNAVAFQFQGFERYGCTAHPGIDKLARGEDPDPPPKKE